MVGTPLNQNRFYNDFDCEFLEFQRDPDYRTPFQRDRDRIIHSSAMRRLQAKTQVFLSGEYDFYRTRLTHSIEVAQIGRSICRYLQHQSDLLSRDFYIDSDLVEAVCLSHDLGHPPFGHAGETTLNRLMENYGGFEGNAQTLRILTEIIYQDSPGIGRTGMNPTRALIDGVMKYKTLMADSGRRDRYFLYDNQARYVDFIFDGEMPPAKLPPGPALNAFQSIECQIMDWADDTAYSLNDITDGIQARFITAGRLEKWGEAHSLTARESVFLEGILQAMDSGELRRIFSRKIGDFIAACRLRERTNFMSGKTNRYKYELLVEKEILQEANFYKTLAINLVFESPQLQQLIYKWNFTLPQIFNAFASNYIDNPYPVLKLLPGPSHQLAMQTAERSAGMRLICDHIAGMTDRFAIRTYKRLYDPGFGSILDLI